MNTKLKKSAPKNRFIENEKTRDKLLKAALNLFAKQGYDATSTKQICDKAGANVAAVTYYFETKENLLKTIFTERLNRDVAGSAYILKEAHSVEELKIRVRMFCETMLEIVSKDREFHQLVAREASVNPIAFNFMKKGTLGFRAVLTTFFKDAKKKGLVKKDVDDSLIGFVVFTLVVGSRLNGVAERIDSQFDFSIPEKRTHYLDRVLRIILEGIL